MPERNPSLYPYEQPAIPGGTLPWVTFLLVISTFIVFALQVEAGAGDDAIVQMFGFSPGNWNGTRPWSILTYAWIHSLNIFERPDLFWFHVVFNMIPLLCLGPALEDRIGHFSFLLLYLGGAAASALAWYVMTPAAALLNDPHLIGASGAVFAVIAGLGTIGPRTRVTFFFAYFLPLQVTAGFVALLTFILEVFSLPFGGSIAHSGHVGGAVFGFLYVLLFHVILGRRES